MKAHNIKPTKVQVADFTFFAVSLGEKGRGRSLVNVACPEQFEFLEPGQTRTGKVRLIRSSSNKGWIARISTEGAYVRGANGNVSISNDYVDKIKVLARGTGAFGAAGRVGSWDDVLLLSDSDNFWVRVKPSRGDAYILMFSEEQVVKVSYEEADLLELDLESTATSRGNLIRI